MKRLGPIVLLLSSFGSAPLALADASCPFITYVRARCTVGSCSLQGYFPRCGSQYGSLRECSNTAGLVICCGAPFEGAGYTRECGVKELRLRDNRPMKLNADRPGACVVPQKPDAPKSTKP